MVYLNVIQEIWCYVSIGNGVLGWLLHAYIYVSSNAGNSVMNAYCHTMKHSRSEIQTTTPVWIASSIISGEGGSGDTCHIFVFSAGINAEPITEIKSHDMT